VGGFEGARAARHSVSGNGNGTLNPWEDFGFQNVVMRT
jgi:hypothetical protein